jgi:hypothetical protein
MESYSSYAEAQNKGHLSGSFWFLRASITEQISLQNTSSFFERERKVFKIHF